MKKIAENIFMLFGYGYNCNSYLLSSSDSGYMLIDSGLGKYDSVWGVTGKNTMKELYETFNLNISKVVLTHAHLDHIGGIASLSDDQRKKFSVYCHEAEKKFIEKPDRRYVDPLMNSIIHPISINQPLSNEDRLEFGSFSFDVIHTPGHTEGSLCLFDAEKKILFSGDCVFPQGSFGRVDFPGSNPVKMLRSLENLSSLDVVSLFAGHMEPLLTNAKNSIHNSYLNAKSMILEE